MFSSLFQHRHVELSPTLTALIVREPTMGAIYAFQRAVEEKKEEALAARFMKPGSVDSEEGEDGNKTGLTPYEDASLSIVLFIAGWSGDDAPTAAEWPDINEEGGVKKRLKLLNYLPKTVFEKLAEECLKAITVTEDEAKNSEAPSE